MKEEIVELREKNEKQNEVVTDLINHKWKRREKGAENGMERWRGQ